MPRPRGRAGTRPRRAVSRSSVSVVPITADQERATDDAQEEGTRHRRETGHQAFGTVMTKTSMTTRISTTMPQDETSIRSRRGLGPR